MSKPRFKDLKAKLGNFTHKANVRVTLLTGREGAGGPFVVGAIEEYGDDYLSLETDEDGVVIMPFTAIATIQTEEP